MTPTLYVGYTQARGRAQEVHIVRDAIGWRSLCGVAVAEAWEVDNSDDATCSRCIRIAND